VIWHGDWAAQCDWRPNLSSKNISTYTLSYDECVDKCSKTLACTHYTWSENTCHLKNGTVSKSDAFPTDDTNAVCGMLNDGVDWSRQTHAFGCDWNEVTNKNMSVGENKTESAEVASADACLMLCLATLNCTHYTFYNSSCWLKSGVVDKSTVVHTGQAAMVCGYVDTGIF
jgi:hypothetical protein